VHNVIGMAWFRLSSPRASPRSKNLEQFLVMTKDRASTRSEMASPPFYVRGRQRVLLHGVPQSRLSVLFGVIADLAARGFRVRENENLKFTDNIDLQASTIMLAILLMS
jgi:hypothetical protein